jgi:hypothetical protein
MLSFCLILLPQVYMEAQDYNALIAACVHHGDASAGGDPQLWAEALEYLSTQPGQQLQCCRESLSFVCTSGPTSYRPGCSSAVGVLCQFACMQPLVPWPMQQAHDCC